MREPTLNAASFPVAHCERCDRKVLTYLGLSEAGGERRCCVRCDGMVESDLEWVDADDLEAEGYYFGSEPPKSSGGACGSGCGSCATRKN